MTENLTPEGVLPEGLVDDTPDSEETPRPGIARRLVDLLAQVYGEAPPVTLTAWDGSRVEPEQGDTGVVAHVESRRTVRRLLWSASQVGIAKAYIAGELTIEGDLEAAVRVMRDYVERASTKRTLEPADRREVLRLTVQLGAVGPAPRGPNEPVDAVAGYLDVPGQMRAELPAALADVVVGDAGGVSAGAAVEDEHDESAVRVEVVFTDPDPLSAAIARWEGEGCVVEGVRDVVDEQRERLAAIAQRLDAHWDDVVEAVGVQHARMWQLSIVLVRDNLERRIVRAYEVSGATTQDDAPA